jgi:tetratricopeptide (TPR) repeat protein
MHALLRRKLHAPRAAPALLHHVDEEITQAPEGPFKTTLLTERARLLTALGRNDDALATWSQVLAFDPHHPAALTGKEMTLSLAGAAGQALWEAEAAHLGVMAEAYAEDAPTAAWLEVERATVLEARLGKVEPARLALTRALSLDARVGPVRHALVRHVGRHRDPGALTRLLDEEGSITTDPARAARLELEAATVAERATGDTDRAIMLLARAAARAPTTPSVDLRILDDLIRLLEAVGKDQSAARYRRARLAVLTDPAARAEELRSLARIAEQTGDLDAAIVDLDASLETHTDAVAVRQIDRLLEGRGRHEPRIALWVTHAARTTDPDKRVAALLKAADIAERGLGKTEEAVRHLRTAWTTTPGHPDVLETLARLLTKPTKDDGARARLELYAHAADVAADTAQRIAYLEKVALLAEETLGDYARAAQSYEAILEVDPARMTALLGLGRNAARTHDERSVERVLLAQARASRSETEALALQTRAAEAIAAVDPALALDLVQKVLAADSRHRAASALLTRLHEDAGRWELVARSLEDQIKHAEGEDKQGLLFYLAEVQETRQRLPKEALGTLRRARDTADGGALAEGRIARTLLSIGEPAALREAYDSLAAATKDATLRARYLVRSAELSEHQLSDDVAALRAYEEAHAATPDDRLTAERVERVRARGRSTTLADPLDRALEAVMRDGDLSSTARDLETLIGLGGDRLPALRLLGRIHRKAKAWPALAQVLDGEAAALDAHVPKLGALWAKADLEEWRLDAPADGVTYARILAEDPGDLAALSAVVRMSLPKAVSGDLSARQAVLDALRRRAPFEAGVARIQTELVLAYLLEGPEGSATDDAAKDALERYRRVLAIDPSSITAASGMRRLAHRLGRVAETVQACTTLAELTPEPKARARHYFEAADLVAKQIDDASLEDTRRRREQAASLFEHALVADPDSLAAAEALTKLLTHPDEADTLVRALRTAQTHARDEGAIIYFGGEIARIAREDLHDLPTATLAMQRVVAVAKTHAPSLLTLAELYLAQRAWPEAVTTLETVVTHADTDEQRLTALFALGSIYDKVLARPDEHERVLRRALAIEPESPRALRGLIEQLRAAKTGAIANPHELALLFHRLAKAEPDPARRCDTYLEAADIEQASGDITAAESSIILAVACCPESGRAFAKLASFFRDGSRIDAVSYARALQDVIAKGRELGNADARWFAALGQLEVDTLRRLPDGIAHLEWAVQLDPTLYESRFELADAQARTGARDAAIRGLMSLIVPDGTPLTSLSDAGLALALLEKLLEQDKRPEEAVVVSELRAAFGEIEPGREDWLKSRRLAPLEEHHTPLGRATLVEEVLPRTGRHVLLEVAVASTGLDAKLLRANLTELGVHGRDRVGARSGHPLRAPFDRVMAVLGAEDIELCVSPAVDRARLIMQDVPWLVVPSSFESLPEAVQLAAMARVVTRALLGVPWLKELRDAGIFGWLVAVARQVVPTYGGDDSDTLPHDVMGYEPMVARAIGRKHKKLLEGLVPHLAQRDGQMPEWAGFLRALDQCTTRAAYLVSGDLGATAAAVALDDPRLRESITRPGLATLAALLSHALTGDVVRFALTPEATTLRKRLGAAWAR